MRTVLDRHCRHLLNTYGCDWTAIPNFQRLAAKALTFDTSYVGSMPCMPARRDLLWDWPACQFVQESPDEIQLMRHNYAVLMTPCDAQLGCVLDAMDAHTPFFFWDPPCRIGGELRKAVVQPSIDLAPALLECFGLEATPDTTGKSRRPVIGSDTPVRDTALFGHSGTLQGTPRAAGAVAKTRVISSLPLRGDPPRLPVSNGKG